MKHPLASSSQRERQTLASCTMQCDGKRTELGSASASYGCVTHFFKVDRENRQNGMTLDSTSGSYKWLSWTEAERRLAYGFPKTYGLWFRNEISSRGLTEVVGSESTLPPMVFCKPWSYMSAWNRGFCAAWVLIEAPALHKVALQRKRNSEWQRQRKGRGRGREKESGREGEDGWGDRDARWKLVFSSVSLRNGSCDFCWLLFISSLALLPVSIQGEEVQLHPLYEE